MHPTHGLISTQVPTGSKKTSSSAKPTQSHGRAAPAAWANAASHLQHGPAPRYSSVQSAARRCASARRGHTSVPSRAGRQPRPAAELSKPFSTTKTTRSKPFAHVSSAGRARWVSQCSGSVCVPLSRFDLPVEST